MARGPRVFVIDDDPAIRRLLRQLLRTAGYRVAEAAPSQDAFLRLAERKFDLLLLDIDEPAEHPVRPDRDSARPLADAHPGAIRPH